MGTVETQPLKVQKAAASAKSVLNMKYGNKAQYRTEAVQESVENGCPGLAILQHTPPCRFRCHLELPEFSVTSDVFSRKKDAEQSAAQMALEKLGIPSLTDNNFTAEEKWEELVHRVSDIFTDEFLSSSHPLIAHFRAAVRRDGSLYCSIPVPVLPACDVKLNNLCKYINPNAESNPSLIIALIIKAARLSGSISISEDLWIGKKIPYSAEVMQTLIDQPSEPLEDIQIEAVHIPCSNEKHVGSVGLYVSSNEYYMDAIARYLNVRDSSRVLISRTVGKASSEMRLYFSSPDTSLLASDSSLELLSNLKTTNDQMKPLFNTRASYFSGQNIYGDAVLATVGYTRKSMGSLFHENVSLRTYYRMLLDREPDGNYKLSREAVLLAELPTTYTKRSNWRGSFPRNLLLTFCNRHRLPEPVFSATTNVSEPPPKLLAPCQKFKTSKSPEEIKYSNVESYNELTGQDVSKFAVTISSRGGDVIIECFPKESYRKHDDVIQNSALKVLTWLNNNLKQLNLSIETSFSSEDDGSVCVSMESFNREFELYRSVHNLVKNSSLRKCKFLRSDFVGNLSKVRQANEICSFNIEGPDCGVSPAIGSLICVSYVVFLVGEHLKEPLEGKDEFEFEIGTGAVIHHLETCVTQMSVDQTALFLTELPSEELILAVADDTAKIQSLLTSQACSLEYRIKLLQVTEPMEDRMEQAFFSPPLSKQRLEYALRHINESHAATLVDFGCGSGSLLSFIYEHPTALEKIVGVDISRKGLIRATKILNSKVSMDSNLINIKEVEIYDGSITEFDSRLYGFDIGTCLEVIEHMEEDQASLFGDIVLSSFCPRILVVSTPNHEYNPILQGSSLPNKEEELDEKTQSLFGKFRNHDHKFEWTRAQFNEWASNLASKHNYMVEFSGVGGSIDIEPGFASQIAIFRQNLPDKVAKNGDSSQPYELVWEWRGGL